MQVNDKKKPQSLQSTMATQNSLSSDGQKVEPMPSSAPNPEKLKIEKVEATQPQPTKETNPELEKRKNLLQKCKNIGNLLLPLIEKTALNDGIPLGDVPRILISRNVITSQQLNTEIVQAVNNLINVYDTAFELGRTNWTLSDRETFIILSSSVADITDEYNRILQNPKNF